MAGMKKKWVQMFVSAASFVHYFYLFSKQDGDSRPDEYH